MFGASVPALQRGRGRRRSQEPRGSRSASFSRTTLTTEAEEDRHEARNFRLSCNSSVRTLQLMSAVYVRLRIRARAAQLRPPPASPPCTPSILQPTLARTQEAACNCAAPMKHPVRIVVAVGPDNGIGYKGGLPWPKLPLDLHMFRQVTTSTQDPLCRVRGSSLPCSHLNRMPSLWAV